MHDGVGNCLITANFFSLGLIPVSNIMCPANSISFPISNFFREMVILFSLFCSNTVHVRMTRSSSLSAQIMVSSTNFLAHGKPSTMMSDLQHHLYSSKAGKYERKENAEEIIESKFCAGN